MSDVAIAIARMNKPIGMKWSIWHRKLAMVAWGTGDDEGTRYHKRMARAERIHEATAGHMDWCRHTLPLP